MIFYEMAQSKSVWNSVFGFFSAKNKNKRSHFKEQKQTNNKQEMTQNASSPEPMNKQVLLRRNETCSIDLSDRRICPKSVQELKSIDSPPNILRRSSFDMDRDFSQNILPISDFEEIEVLGQGAFGRAVKVRWKMSNQQYVLKEVLSHSKENEEALIREVSLLKSLRHKNILTYSGLVLKDKRICLLTELMHGGSLQAKILDMDQDISLHEKINYLKDISSGMEFVHRNSIMHRDLTSSNCLISKENRVVISDFGLSKFFNSETIIMRYSNARTSISIRSSSSEIIDKIGIQSNYLGSNLQERHRNFLSVSDVSEIGKTSRVSDGSNSPSKEEDELRIRPTNLRRKHTVVGNPFWMAPEMLAGKSYNDMVDIYSFGIIGCELTARIAAHPESLERNQRDMSVNFNAFLIKNGKSGRLDNCPHGLLELIRQCCNSDPDLRPSFDIILSYLEDISFCVSNKITHKLSKTLTLNN